ncbi:MAG: preprotein translocase subunit SecF [Glaciecola sp.]|jgi:preprotein translocase subunit SecF
MKRFDFIGNRRRGSIISVVLLSVTALTLIFSGLNFSIDFVGGSSFVIDDVTNAELTVTDLQDAASGAGATDVTAQIRQDGDVIVGALVQSEELPPGSPELDAVRTALMDVAGSEQINFTTVGPSWGQRISSKAIRALIVFLIVVVAYISLRLEPLMAVASVVALVHDVAITVGIYALVGFTISPSTVIAILTILGYSLYDSVVVFDRVQENRPKLGESGHRTLGESVNTSLNDVLWRSVNTSVTSLLPVGSLLFVGSQLLGADTLADLALALFLGMAIGAYSSIFVAVPLYATLKERDPEMTKLAAKAKRQALASGEEVLTTSSVEAEKGPITTEYVRGGGKKRRTKR